MADKKISQLTGATTPLAGTEVLPIVQGGSTVKVAVSNLTAGRLVNASAVTTTGNIGVGISPNANWRSGARAVQAGANGYLTLWEQANGAANLAFGAYENGANTFAYSTTGDTPALFSQLSGAFTWSNAAAGTAGGTFTPTQRMGLDSSGNLTVNTGNLVVGTAGKGINFSANTPSTGSTSQLLNWYEEGTWTPTVEASYGTLNSYTSAGKYTKIGRQVCLQIQVSALNVTGATGIKITNLPFTMAEGTVVGTRENNGAGLAWNWGSSSATTTTIFAWRYDNVTDVANGFAWKFTLTYFV